MAEISLPPLDHESVILCEGYDDRAFWVGWLMRLGCIRVPSRRLAGTSRDIVYDHENRELPPGEYAYRSRSERFVRIVPCLSREAVTRRLRLRLAQRGDQPLARLIVALDSDVPEGGEVTALPPSDWQRVNDLATAAGGVPIPSDPTGWAVGDSTVSLITWAASDPPLRGLPQKQTLERLVCAAVVAAYGSRAECVQRWLDSRQDTSDATPKHFAWSYYAGWFANHGTGDYYRCVWEDAAIAQHLRTRLEATGAWQIAEAIAQE